MSDNRLRKTVSCILYLASGILHNRLLKTVAVSILLVLALSFSYAIAWDEETLENNLQSVILPFFANQLEYKSFKGVGGLNISYAKLEVPDEKGALIISNGRTESLIKYAELIYDLRKSGFSIYILDHRGQGFSDRMLDDPQKGQVESFEDYVADFKTFMDTLVNAGSHKRRFVLAHSMGGAIAALYAIRYPDDLDGLILCAPMMQINTSPYPPFVASIIVNGFTALGKGDAYVMGGGGYDPNKPFEGNELTHSRVRFNMNKIVTSLNPQIALGGPTNRWVREAFRAGRRARKNAATIDAPILLLQAGMDSVVRPDGQDDFCRAAQNCKKVTMTGANHEILMEKDEIRDKALDHIREFLKTAASSR